MKKVRFESPKALLHFRKMDDTDIQSPRPYNTLQIQPEEPKQYTTCLTKPDPLQVFDYSDYAPHYQPQRSKLNDVVSPQNGSNVTVKPSEQLDLSILDIGSPEPRKPLYSKFYPQKPFRDPKDALECVLSVQNNQKLSLSPCISPVPSSKKSSPPPKNITKDNSFFIRRENLENLPQIKTNWRKHKNPSDNHVVKKKLEIMKTITQIPQGYIFNQDGNHQIINQEPVCYCHHCKVTINRLQTHNFNNQYQNCCPYSEAPFINPSPQNHTKILEETTNICQCNQSNKKFEQAPKNVVDKKKWCIENYKQSTISNETNELQKNLSVPKEKREPSVADLFRIIKLQNEQLQLLQEKVDRYISTNNNTQQIQQSMYPIQNYVAEQVTLETTKNSHKKISIGVMTSFEMITTSTVINKDVNTNRSAQIQCNRSHISVKEVISQQPVNVNFLDGLKPIVHSPPLNNDIMNGNDNNIAEKINELSLCNVQVDNASTPSLSPEQTMYLDVRDYSGSDSNSSDQSNVGWTYYNKVMTHVNGMLQESDMPSSASALFRNTRQHCMQMQIDKTNVSVTKRVTFGEDLHMQKSQSTPNQPTTDTSMKMNQLAAKYLKQRPAVVLQHIPKPPTANQNNMSFATRNYMERHHLLPGMTPLPYQPPPAPASPVEMPRFLDITALKQQPKLL